MNERKPDGITATTATRPGWMRRFARHRAGATAVEFAMIAPLLFGSLFAIIESGTLYLKATAMEAGVEEAKRVTMTGQVAGAGAAEAQIAKFRSAFCSQVDWIISCDAVKFDVRAFDTFGLAAMPNPVVDGVLKSGDMQFNTGKPCQIVVIRAYYEATAITARIRNDVAQLANRNVLISGSAAFKNEPFGAC
ncbi:MAG: pilus assembly protein [Hyphomicrobiales bacterium]|uniref:TadE/TadG family type IV pilus assembly protein n=1 Tax=Rhabdaerophilum calidifontis TaxID=2604328 RepID=UPI00123B1470|nr:TadE/TadG family type IV pilus assembly protein [Rhabdaerophilum calidifontis]MCA1952137.1 pilus assembly protein [Hyphomicrobiales bacterium]